MPVSMQRWTLPFSSEFCLAFLIEDKLGITVAPAIPFHNLMPANEEKKKKKNINLKQIECGSNDGLIY